MGGLNVFAAGGGGQTSSGLGGLMRGINVSTVRREGLTGLGGIMEGVDVSTSRVEGSTNAGLGRIMGEGKSNFRWDGIMGVVNVTADEGMEDEPFNMEPVEMMEGINVSNISGGNREG